VECFDRENCAYKNEESFNIKLRTKYLKGCFEQITSSCP
jgi:hypothetical protein